MESGLGKCSRTCNRLLIATSAAPSELKAVENITYISHMSAEKELVVVHKLDNAAIWHIALNRPTVRNAVDYVTGQQLAHALIAFDKVKNYLLYIFSSIVFVSECEEAASVPLGTLHYSSSSTQILFPPAHGASPISLQWIPFCQIF